MITKNKLDVVLLEYETIRKELIEQVKNQMQIYSLSIAGLSLLFSYIIIDNKFDALLISSLMIFVLGFRWLWDIEMSVLYSAYLREISSNKIPRLIGYVDNSCTNIDEKSHLNSLIGWQYYYDNNRTWRSRGWSYSVFLLFGLPLIFSWIYFCISLITLIGSGDINKILTYPFFLYTIEWIFIPIFGVYTYQILRKCRNKNNESIERSRNISMSNNQTQEDIP